MRYNTRSLLDKSVEVNRWRRNSNFFTDLDLVAVSAVTVCQFSESVALWTLSTHDFWTRDQKIGNWLTNEIDSTRLRKYERSFVRNVNKKVRITFVRLIKCKVTLFTSSNHHHYRFFHDHLSASNNEIRLHVHYRISRIRYTCIISYILCFRNERRNLKKQTRNRCNVALIVRRVDWRGQETTAIEKGEKK